MRIPRKQKKKAKLLATLFSKYDSNIINVELNYDTYKILLPYIHIYRGIIKNWDDICNLGSKHTDGHPTYKFIFAQHSNIILVAKYVKYYSNLLDLEFPLLAYSEYIKKGED